MSSFASSRHLSIGLPRVRFPSTVICNIFLVTSSLFRLCTGPNHLNLFSLRNSAIGYMCVPLSRCLHFSHDLVLSDNNTIRSDICNTKMNKKSPDLGKTTGKAKWKTARRHQRKSNYEHPRLAGDYQISQRLSQLVVRGSGRITCIFVGMWGLILIVFHSHKFDKLTVIKKPVVGTINSY